MDYSLLGSFVYEILSQECLEWVDIPSPGDLADSLFLTWEALALSVAPLCNRSTKDNFSTEELCLMRLIWIKFRMAHRQ